MKKNLMLKRCILILIFTNFFAWPQSHANLLDRIFHSDNEMSRQQMHVPPQGVQSGPAKMYLGKRQSSGYASLTGTVLNANNTPNTSSMVTVIDTFGYVVAQARCNLNGIYTVDIINPGTYCVWANPQGYSNREDRVYVGNTDDISKATWLRFSGGEKLTGKDITLGSGSSLSKKGVVISGRCFLGSDTAISLKKCSFSFRFKPVDPKQRDFFPSEFQFNSCTTGDDGTYSCTTSLDPGDYYVMLTRNTGYSSTADSAIIPQWWDGAPATSDLVATQFSTSSIVKDVHFRTGAMLIGTLRDELSDSLKNSVTINIIDNNGYTLAYSYCYPPLKKFVFAGLPDGVYYLRASGGIDAPYLSTFYPSVTSRDSASPISIVGGESREGIEFVLKRNPASVMPVTLPSGRIQGKITREDNGSPIPFASVHISKNATGNDTIVRADSTGHYEISVPADSILGISAQQNAAVIDENYVNDYFLAQTSYPGTTNLSAPTGVKVAVNETKQIDIALKKGGSIAGWLTDSHGSKVPGLTSILNSDVFFLGVTWKGDFSAFASAELSDIGGFRFAGMDPGDYVMRFIPLTGLIYGQSVSDYCFTNLSAQTVTKENTAFSRTIAMPQASAIIKGVVAPEPGEKPTTTRDAGYVYCYSGDSVLAAICLSGTSEGQSTRSLFLSWTAPASIAGPQSFAIGKFPAGKYALARLMFNTGDGYLSREWYSTGTLEKIEITDYKKFYKEFLKPDIPANAWISLADGETKTGINFGNVGVGSPTLSGNAEGRLKLVREVGRQSDVFHYYLPLSGSKKPGELNVYKFNGTKVRTIRLTSESGDVVWDRREGSGRGVSSGIYVFRLSQGDKSAVVKDAVVR